LYPGSIAGRSRVWDTDHPVAYIHFSLAKATGETVDFAHGEPELGRPGLALGARAQLGFSV
jgi:hypothetical protein